jgi:hypothetical protein
MKQKSTLTYIILSTAIALFWSAVAVLAVLAGAPAWIILATFLIAFMVCMLGFSMCAVTPAEKP